MLAELTIEGVGAGAVGVLIVAVLIGFALLQKFQDGRKALAEELRREIFAEREPQQVELQSPLAVKAHVEFTPIGDHQRLVSDFREHRTEVDQRFRDMSGASSQSREKIYQLIREQNTAMNVRIDAIPERTIELLATTKKLHD
ncbi:MAG: hypothetical protein IPL39_14510 [Opitutaceae bacterium]|nr:hypothetical protein [Opitutaceae bacterium]